MRPITNPDFSAGEETCLPAIVLLALSRISMEDIQVDTIDMNELVYSALEELNEMKGKSMVILNPLISAQGDQALIKQVVTNLLSNAFKYAGQNRNPKIEIGCYPVDDEIHYYVSDNGVGFDREYSKKLFVMFQRLHDDPQEYHGAGIGLAIVRHIMAFHGGRVWADGREGRGATFYFSLKANGENVGH